MKNKSRGFTLIEVLIVLSLTVVVLAVVFGILNTNNKSLIETDIKSTLQSEAEDMQMNISKIGMQAKRITAAAKDVPLSDDSDKGIAEQPYDTEGFLSVDENNKYYMDAEQVNLAVPIDETSEGIYKIKFKKSDKQLVLVSSSGGEKVLSRNVKSFKIKTNNMGCPEKKSAQKLTQAKAVTFKIELEKKQGYSKVQYPVLITVNFRNSDI